MVYADRRERGREGAKMSVIIVLEDQVYRVTDKVYTRLKELERDCPDDGVMSDLVDLCDEILDGKKGRLLGYIQFDWRR